MNGLPNKLDPQSVLSARLPIGISLENLVPLLDAKGRKRGLKGWVICPICKEGRWLSISSMKSPTFTGMCQYCHNKFTSGRRETHSHWKGGRRQNADGYIEVNVPPDDFFRPMASRNGSNNYILEHRLVMAKHLCRCLLPWEVVHHKNGNKADNRLENLELMAGSKHHLASIGVQAVVARLKKKIAFLEEELRKMREIAK